MKYKFQAYFYTPEAMELNRNGIIYALDLNKHTIIKNIIVDVQQVESACESTSFQGGTALTMFSGEYFVLTMCLEDYERVTKPINSKHLLCQMNN